MSLNLEVINSKLFFLNLSHLDLEQKFFIAQNTDKDVFKKFDQYEEWMHKFSFPDDQILTLIPRSSDNDFIQHNKSKLAELSTYNAKVVNLMDLEKQRAYLLTMTEEFMKTDFLPSFAAINAKQVDKNAEFDKMLAPYMQKLGQIEGQVTHNILQLYSNSFTLDQWSLPYFGYYFQCC